MCGINERENVNSSVTETLIAIVILCDDYSFDDGEGGGGGETRDRQKSEKKLDGSLARDGGSPAVTVP